MRAATIASVLIVGVLSGCGGDEPAGPAAVMSTYLSAVADGDGERACAQLTEATRQATLRAAARNFPDLDAKTCGQALTRLLTRLSEAERTQVRETKVRLIAASDARATVELREGAKPAQLLKRDGRWYVSGGLFQE
ncbi:hypothetical protein [Paraconexibacter sp. AEG42_29]|uniref:hypothetical protein n=1 Tax=Paraconexibacter sp. AEG42_29 TaxID=2997339 RepID=UPI00339D42ED